MLDTADFVVMSVLVNIPIYPLYAAANTPPYPGYDGWGIVMLTTGVMAG